MMNIISSEYYKIFKSKIFYAISIILLSLSVIAIAVSVQKLAFAQTQTLETGISGYQGIFSVDMIFYIILIFVACLITADYANGSIRQMACHGIARWKLVVGRYIAISSVITLILFVFGMIILLIGAVTFKMGQFDASAFIRMNIGLACMFWGVSGIGTFLSYLLKNGGITVAVSVLLILSRNFIVRLLSSLIKSNIFLKYCPSNMRSIIIDLTSKPGDVVICSVVFLLIGIVTTVGSCILFSIRDVD